MDSYENSFQLLFYHYDKRGSTTAVIEPDGDLIEGYEYDEFGNLTLTENNGFLNETTFTGSITDTSTGLQYMNARFYDPQTARFISQDTYTGNAYDPWTQHLYAYTGNNPTNFVDPTGHRPIMGSTNDPRDEKWTKKNGKWKYLGTRKPPVVPQPKPEPEDADGNVTSKSGVINEYEDTQLSELMDIWLANSSNTGTFTIAQLEGTGTGSVIAGTTSIQLVMDFRGNMGIQWTYGGGGDVAASLASASAMLTAGGTNAEDIEQLLGYGYEIGGSGGSVYGGTFARVVGLDIDDLRDLGARYEDLDSLSTYGGFQGGVGFTTPGGEGHAIITYTQPVGETWRTCQTPVLKQIINITDFLSGHKLSEYVKETLN